MYHATSRVGFSVCNFKHFEVGDMGMPKLLSAGSWIIKGMDQPLDRRRPHQRPGHARRALHHTRRDPHEVTKCNQMAGWVESDETHAN